MMRHLVSVKEPLEGIKITGPDGLDKNYVSGNRRPIFFRVKNHWKHPTGASHGLTAEADRHRPSPRLRGARTDLR